MYPVPEIQGSTQEIAKFKCKRAAEMVNGPCITEVRAKQVVQACLCMLSQRLIAHCAVQDTALCFSALDNLPGPYIKDFLQSLGHQGLNNLLAAYSDKSATALCTFGYCASPDSEPILFEGRTAGNIVPARGPSNFGWDPIFEVQGSGKT